jgi:hypothetical protein
MSGLVCSHCGKPVELFGTGGGKKTAEAAGITFLGSIPFDAHLVSCGDAGISYQEKFKDSAVTQAFTNVAKRITQ